MPKASKAAQNGHVDLKLTHDDDLEGEWRSTRFGFDAFLVPQVGTRFARALNHVAIQLGAGRGRKYGALNELPMDKQWEAGLRLAAKYGWSSYRTASDTPIKVNGIDYPNTEEGRYGMLQFRPIRDEIIPLIDSVTFGAAEDAEQEERALEAAAGN